MATKKTTTSAKPAAKKTAKKSAPAKKAATKPVATTAPAVTVKDITAPPTTLTFKKAGKSIPIRHFVPWSVGVIAIIALLGIWLAQTLVSTREDSLMSTSTARVALQAQGKAAVVEEWLHGILGMADNITQSDLVRLFTAEIALEGIANDEANSNGGVRRALRAQLPYMQQMIKEFTARHKLLEAALLGHNGDVYLAHENFRAASALQQRGVEAVFATGLPQVLPLREIPQGPLVMDILKPVFMLEEEVRDPAVVGVFMLTLPVAEKLSVLLNDQPLDAPGERVFLLQRMGPDGLAQVGPAVGVEPLGITPSTLQALTLADRPVISPVDQQEVFGRSVAVNGTPFAVWQEYLAEEALSFLILYKNGVYGMVSLASFALMALMITGVGHLLAQRNRVRVRLLGQTMTALVRSVEIWDPYLSGHHNAVARLAIQVGNTMKLPVEQRSTLFYAAQLAGVGKAFVPQEILTKNGKLTPAERKTMQSHVAYAMKVLEDIDFDLPIASVIYHMSERMDGSGYPQALKGDDIHQLSRVLAVCDVYVALTKPRSYRKALTGAEAMKELDKNAKQYDQTVVVALKQVLALS